MSIDLTNNRNSFRILYEHHFKCFLGVERKLFYNIVYSLQITKNHYFDKNIKVKGKANRLIFFNSSKYLVLFFCTEQKQKQKKII